MAYDVTITDGIMHGIVTASPVRAVAGVQITLNIKPDTGYMLDTLTATDADSNALSVENNQFLMPSSNVTVMATFKSLPKFTVTFAAGYENPVGTMEDVIVDVGTVYTLPACGFNAPEGKAFNEWSVVTGDETTTKEPGETIIVNADTNVTAVWIDAEAKPKFTGRALLLSGEIGV